MRHIQSKFLSGKLQLATKQKKVAKIVLYCMPNDMLAILDAIGQTTAADLVLVDEAGSQNGRAVAAICRDWLKGRVK